jgi:hypothetical protein
MTSPSNPKTHEEESRLLLYSVYPRRSICNALRKCNRLQRGEVDGFVVAVFCIFVASLVFYFLGRQHGHEQGVRDARRKKR